MPRPEKGDPIIASQIPRAAVLLFKLTLYESYSDERECLHAGGQRAQRWPPAGPPNFAQLSPEGVSSQNFHDFRIFMRLDFELSRSDFQCFWAQLLKSGPACENHEFLRCSWIFMKFSEFSPHDLNFCEFICNYPRHMETSHVYHMNPHMLN